MAILNKIFTNCLNSSDTQIFQYNDLLFVPGSVISQNGNCYRDTQITSDLVATLSIKSTGFTNCQECLTTTMTGLVVSGCSGGTFMYLTLPNDEVPPIGYAVLYNSFCWTVVSATTEFYNVQSNIPSFEDCETCNLFGTTVERTGGGSTTGPGDPGDPGGGGGGAPYQPNYEVTKFVQCCDSSVSRWYEIDINPQGWGPTGAQVYYDFTDGISWGRTNVICNPPYQNCISFGQLPGFLYPNCSAALWQANICPTPSVTQTPTATPQQYSYWGASLLVNGTPPTFQDACNLWVPPGQYYYGFKPFNLLQVNDYLYSAASRNSTSLVVGSNNSVLPLASSNTTNVEKHFQVLNTGRIAAIVNCTPITFYPYKISEIQVLSGYFTNTQDACNYPFSVYWDIIYGLKPIDQLGSGDVLYATSDFSTPLTGFYWLGNTYRPMYEWSTTTNTIVGPKYVVRSAVGGNGAISFIATCNSVAPPFTPTPTITSTGCVAPGTIVDCVSYKLFANGNTAVVFNYDRCTDNGIDYGLEITVQPFSEGIVCSSSRPTFVSGGPYDIQTLLGCNRICIGPTPTPTLTPTNTSTNTTTPTNTETPTPTNTSTPTNTTTPTNTVSPTQSPSITPTSSQTGTPPPSGTNFATPTPSVTNTQTPTNTSTNTQTPTNTPTNTLTNTQTPTNTSTNMSTQTPTLTQTSSQTGTPVLTPTNTPSVTRRATTTTTRPSGIEECRVITVEPMGVTCNVINATIPGTLSTAALIITGGTSPYNILWDHGINRPQHQILNNLTNGIYSATVTDYYGDYTVKVFCVVTGASISVTSTPTVTPTQTGTPPPSGTAGPTPPVTSTPTFTPSPTVTSVSQLCATFNITDGNGIQRFEQYQFFYGNQINGTNSWTATTTQNYLTNSGSLLLRFQPTVSNLGNWYISQISASNNIVWPFTILTGNANRNLLPTNGWGFLGPTTYTDSFGRSNTVNSLQVTIGQCTVPPLSITTSTTNATCPGISDGSVTITAFGGTPTYSYSLDNTNFQISNTFINLSNGFYTAYIKDSTTPPQTSSQSFIINTTYNQAQPTTLNFTQTVYIPLANNSQPTIIDNFSSYELNLNQLANGVSLSTLNFDLEIQNITSSPGTTDAIGTAVTVLVNNQTVFTTGVTSSTLWSETSTQPRGNVACSNELTTTKRILVPNRFGSSLPIRIAAFLGRPIEKTDVLIINITNKARIISPSTIQTCPTELTNKIMINTNYTYTGPNQNCFPVQGNPFISVTDSRSATQAVSTTYTGEWRIQVTNAATCFAVVSVKTQGMIGSGTLNANCNRQSTSIPNPWPSGQINVFRGQTLIVQPPAYSTCVPIPVAGSDYIQIQYIMYTSTNCTNTNSPGNSTPCSGDYELMLYVDQQQYGPMLLPTIGGVSTVALIFNGQRPVINPNSNVTIIIDCV